jgi:2-keto-4-pentenoate hydratase/2-oxohepta-3-ene-1,7-dioic acid hydratase in catechol pathway
MKLVNFISGGKTHCGVETARGVVDITALGLAHSIDEVIAGGEGLLTRIAGAVMDETLPVLDGVLEYATVTTPQKILCVGLNYRKHAEETGGEPPKDIVFFSKFNDALEAAGRPVPLPTWQRCYDYEAELVIVMGKTAWNVPKEEALNYVFGYTCGNDLSARDSQFLSSQWLAGKSFPGFAPAGPCVVTKDAFDPNADNRITCSVNGEVVQEDVTSGMIFDCAEIVSTASRFFKLGPGDLIFTGTPAGVILGKPKGTRVWLKKGDTVRITIEGIGTLTTPLV